MYKQNTNLSARFLLLPGMLVALLAIFPGCDRPAQPASPPQPADEPVRVASLVPAVTNMLLELDAGEHLVAVSNYDTDPRVADLPRVGDLINVDWEQLLAADPDVMVVQADPTKISDGVRQRAGELEIELLPIQLTRLDDLRRTLDVLHERLEIEGEPWGQRFARRLDALAADDGAEPVPTLILLNPDGTFTVGRDNYLNSLLEHVGGENVIPPELPQYPSIDRETLLTLRPDRVVFILPGATPAQLEEAKRFWNSLPADWPVAWEDVLIITDPYALTPGWSVLDLAERLQQVRVSE